MGRKRDREKAAKRTANQPAWERFMAHELLGVDPIEIPGGHFPMLEDPVGLADLLGRVEHQHRQDLARCSRTSE